MVTFNLAAYDITKTIDDIDMSDIGHSLSGSSAAYGADEVRVRLKESKMTSLLGIASFTAKEIAEIARIPFSAAAEVLERAKEGIALSYSDMDKLGISNLACEDLRFVMTEYGFDMRGTIADEAASSIVDAETTTLAQLKARLKEVDPDRILSNAEKYRVLLQLGRRRYDAFASYYRQDLFVAVAAHPERSASGLRWREVEARGGIEVVHEGLKKALETKRHFSPEEWTAFRVDDLTVDHFVVVKDKYYRPCETVSLRTLAQHGYQCIVQSWSACVRHCHPKSVELNLKNYRVRDNQGQNGFVYLEARDQKHRLHWSSHPSYKVHICVRANAVLQALQDLDNYKDCTKISGQMKLPVAKSSASVSVPLSHAHTNLDGGGAGNIIMYTTSDLPKQIFEFIEYWKTTKSEAQFRITTPIRFNTRVSKSIYVMYGGDTMTRTDELLYKRRVRYQPSSEIQKVRAHICTPNFADDEQFQQQACLQKNYGMSRKDLCDSDVPNVWKEGTIGSDSEISRRDARMEKLMTRCISRADWPVERKRALLDHQRRLMDLAPDLANTLRTLLENVKKGPTHRRLKRDPESMGVRAVYDSPVAVDFLRFVGWWEAAVDSTELVWPWRFPQQGSQEPLNADRFIFYGRRADVDEGLQILRTAEQLRHLIRAAGERFGRELPADTGREMTLPATQELIWR